MVMATARRVLGNLTAEACDLEGQTIEPLELGYGGTLPLCRSVKAGLNNFEKQTQAGRHTGNEKIDSSVALRTSAAHGRLVFVSLEDSFCLLVENAVEEAKGFRLNAQARPSDRLHQPQQR